MSRVIGKKKRASSKPAPEEAPVDVKKKRSNDSGLFCDTVEQNVRSFDVSIDSFAAIVPTSTRTKDEVNELARRFETPIMPNKASTARMRQLDTFVAPPQQQQSTALVSTTSSGDTPMSTTTVNSILASPRYVSQQQTQQEHAVNTNSFDSIDLPDVDIDSLQFVFLSTEEILRWSVLEITNSKLSGNNSVFDLRMGPAHPNSPEECATCHFKGKVCPGHFGHIKLPCKVPHPLRIKLLCDFLNLFCHDCFYCVVRDKAEIDDMIHKAGSSGERRFNAFLEVRKRVEICPRCFNVLPEIKVIDDMKFERIFKGKKFPVGIAKIEEIFDNIPPCDIELLGLDAENVHPSKLLMGALLVMPPCARPSITRSFAKVSNGPAHDDLTINYTEIFKTVKKYEEAVTSKNEKSKAEAYENLCFRVRTMMDNSKNKAKNNLNKRGLKCIKNRMRSKTGLIRGHIQGKRVDFCARSVITPEATGWVDELVVPEDFAKNITFPVKVNRHNLMWCQRLLDNNKVVNVYSGDSVKSAKKLMYTNGFELRDNDVIERLVDGRMVRIDVYTYKEQYNKLPELKRNDAVVRYQKRFTNVPIRQLKAFSLHEGDVIERQLMNGDWTLFNRQPTLWKGSMRAMRVKVMPGKTFRFNMACTQAYNADHDGDEMNAFFAQSDFTRAESMELVSVGKNFTSSQDSKPMLAIKQDAMTGAYKLTYGRVPVPRETFMDCFTHEKFSMDRYMHKREHVLKTYRHLGWFDGVEDEDKVHRLEHELLYCGHTLFSFLLPDDFEYFLDNKMSPVMDADGKPEPVRITRGVLVSGTLNKDAMGSASASLIHHLWKDYGEKEACWFVSMYQICINFWFAQHGFSVGLEDCIATDSDVVESQMQRCFLKAHAILMSEPDHELKEMGVMMELNKAATIGQKHARAALKPDNNLVSMIRSGSKGDWLNITQVTGLVGQQNVSAKRIAKTFGNRTLPHFKKQGRLISDPDVIGENASVKEVMNLFRSRGFVTSNFYKGLTPTEFFFLAAGGREGLIDSGCKTADTVGLSSSLEQQLCTNLVLSSS